MIIYPRGEEWNEKGMILHAKTLILILEFEKRFINLRFGFIEKTAYYFQKKTY